MVPHEDGFRRLWMFPRNIRHIYPWKMSQLISIFYQLNTEYGQWIGNPEAQESFTSEIYLAGLKKGESQRDPNPGGPRTYQAQMESLGLIYQNSADIIGLTIAGEKIHNGEAPLPIMQQLLFRYQYPSVYSSGSGVKISPLLKVKPFHFVLKLAEDLGHLTVEEMLIPVLLGHQNSDYNDCKNRIEIMRSHPAPLDYVLEILMSDPLLAYTNRAKTERSSPREVLEKRLNDIKDIANTCKCYLEACYLLTPDEANPKEFLLTEDSRNLLQQLESSFDTFLDASESEEQFQRKFGAIDRVKDTRRAAPAAPVRIDPEVEMIKRLIRRAQNESPEVFDLAKFSLACKKDFNLDQSKVLKVATDFREELFDQFETSFLELASGGQRTAANFEKTITRLLKEIGLNASHIGQRYREAGTGGYTDVLVELNHFCGLIDGKAYSKYTLNSADFAKIVTNYIPHVNEICSKPLVFFSLIAADFSSGVGPKLQEIYDATGIPVSAMKATAFIKLYKLVLNEKIMAEDFITPFMLCKVIDVTTIEELFPDTSRS